MADAVSTSLAEKRKQEIYDKLLPQAFINRLSKINCLDDKNLAVSVQIGEPSQIDKRQKNDKYLVSMNEAADDKKKPCECEEDCKLLNAEVKDLRKCCKEMQKEIDKLIKENELTHKRQLKIFSAVKKLKHSLDGRRNSEVANEIVDSEDGCKSESTRCDKENLSLKECSSSVSAKKMMLVIQKMEEDSEFRKCVDDLLKKSGRDSETEKQKRIDVVTSHRVRIASCSKSPARFSHSLRPSQKRSLVAGNPSSNKKSSVENRDRLPLHPSFSYETKKYLARYGITFDDYGPDGPLEGDNTWNLHNEDVPRSALLHRSEQSVSYYPTSEYREVTSIFQRGSSGTQNIRQQHRADIVNDEETSNYGAGDSSDEEIKNDWIEELCSDQEKLEVDQEHCYDTSGLKAPVRYRKKYPLDRFDS